MQTRGKENSFSISRAQLTLCKGNANGEKEQDKTTLFFLCTTAIRAEKRLNCFGIISNWLTFA